MPALRLCGRSWLVALDDVVPSFAFLHVLFVHTRDCVREMSKPLKETCGKVGEKALIGVRVSVFILRGEC